MQREIEIKFKTDPQTVDRLSRLSAVSAFRVTQGPTLRLAARYFDTPDGWLAARKLALRTRMAGEQWTLTVKAPGDGIHRQEWEWQTPSGELDWSLLDTIDALKDAPRAQIMPKFETDINRQNRYLSDDANTGIELALDLGRVISGPRSVELCEVELELKRGAETALWRAAIALAEAWPLRLSLDSKAGVGQRLNDPSLPAPVEFAAGAETLEQLRRGLVEALANGRQG